MLPTNKTAKSRKRARRSHHALTPAHTVVCRNCGSAKLPHAACSNCGYVKPGVMLKLNEEE